MLLLPLCVLRGMSQENPARTDGRTVTFRFVPGRDMFYVPWKKNGAELERLFGLLDDYSAEIAAGTMPVCVDGYCTSMPTREENLRTAAMRSNHVKSTVITRKGLTEANFLTHNHAGAYRNADGDIYKEVVVVTLHIPSAATATQEAEAKAAQAREAADAEAHAKLAEETAARQATDAEAAARSAEAAQAARQTASAAARQSASDASSASPYLLGLRTNLLYDALALPTLGVEWRISPAMGIRLDGSRAQWGSQRGRVQKVWLLSPEVRWYLQQQRRLYLGLSANVGRYNIYKYILGGILSDGGTGYQGHLWSAGLTVGYQLPLARHLALDFGLGLGYTRSGYDSFTLQGDGTRTYKQRDRVKNLWGPTQASVSLVWTVGGKNRLR